MNFLTYSQETDFENKDYFCSYQSSNADYAFFFENEIKDKYEYSSINDIKSTYKVGSSNDHSSISEMNENFAPVNEDMQLDWNNHSDAYINLLCEVQYGIYNGGINELIDEVLENQFGNELEQLRPIQKKRKKTSVESEYLEEALKENKDWDKKFMEEIAAKLDLSYRQIYKWYWERVKRANKKVDNKKINKCNNNKFEDLESTFALAMN